ncbi:MAG: rhomboid family intramembrane serine protease [Bacteroidales bacterium]
MITGILVAVTVVVSLVAFRNQEFFSRLDLAPARVVHKGEYHRLFSHALLHADYVHLGINMLVLFSFGRGVESIFQELEAQGVIFSWVFFYLLLYVAGVVLSSVSTVARHRNDPEYSSIGASGAVSAVIFTYIFFAPLQKIYFYAVLPLPGIVFGILYLIYSSVMDRRSKDNVNHEAHFWGAVVGFVFPLFLDPHLIRHFIQQLLP